MQFIITYTPHFRKSVLKELQEIDNEITFKKHFEDNLSLIESTMPQSDFLILLEKKKPFFIKHIAPARKEGEITGDLDEDKATILETLLLCGHIIEKDEKFAIQVRICNGRTKENQPLPYSSKDLEVFIGSYFTEKGGVPIFSDKKIINEDNIRILSIFLNENNFYLGDSNSNQNLNFSCNEYRVSSASGKQKISRAENKLREALAKYKIELGGGKALDIGASPGGWTKVLLEYGFFVDAVDPGELNPTLLQNPKVKHHKCKIENVVQAKEFSKDGQYDIIVNDMNVDPATTATIMNILTPCLKEEGLAIVTLKLPGNPEKGIQEGLKILSENYKVLERNSLFHNRQEITTLLQKRKEP